MKQAISQNQVHVETEVHSVADVYICYNSMGGSSLKVSRQTMFHIQGLPAAFMQGLSEAEVVTN